MSEDDFDLIEADILGNLSEEERQQLEIRRVADPNFATKVSGTSEAIMAARRAGAKAAIRTASQRHSIRTTQAVLYGRPMRTYIAAAASLLLIASVALWAVNWSQTRSPEHLALAYFEPAIGLPTLLGPSEDLQFEEGMVDYKLGDFTRALTAWEPLLKADAANDTLLYYVGVSRFAAADVEGGLAALEDVKSAALRDDAAWYKGLALLHLGREGEAKDLFEEVSMGSGSYRDQARRLLDEL